MPTESEHYDFPKPLGTDGVTRAAYNLLIDAIDAALWVVQQMIIGHAGTGGTAHAIATQLAAGFLSAADKVKLDTLAETFAPIAHVGAGGAAHQAATTGQAGFMSAADKTALNALNGHGHAVATEGANGFMSYTDKSNLTALATGYDRQVLVGSATFADYDTNSNQRLVGFVCAPRGGLMHQLPRKCSSLTNLKIAVQNISGSNQALTWRFPHIDGSLRIYVDGVEVTTNALTGANQSFAYTLANGLHTVQFRLASAEANEDEGGEFIIADWLTSVVLCQPGESLYF